MATILWVEDEANQISGLVRPLIIDGHTVVVAIDKKDALQKLTTCKADLIILDLIIPAGTDTPYSTANPQKRTIEPYEGMLLLKEIKQTSPNVPILVLTIVNDEDALEEVRVVGVEKILRKGSYLPSDLKREVYDLLGITA